MCPLPQQGLCIAQVESGSIAEQLDIEPGDIILAINEQPVNDILDYRFGLADDVVQITIQKSDLQIWELEIEKDPEDDLGVSFAGEGLEPIKKCRNNCIFCFVAQMPPDMRPTLYVRDDDYRHSFLYGNFITLTNLTLAEKQRIVKQRLSPLYVSVHTTDPELRAWMMRQTRAAYIMDDLKYFTQNGITVHTQAVLCPGINDGQHLERTVSDLLSLWPGVASLAVVPVGLTAHRQNLPAIKGYTPGQASQVLDIVHDWRVKAEARCDYPFVFASDEFYLLAGQPIPGTEYYADFPQVENGVGLTRLFFDEWEEVKLHLPSVLSAPLRVTLVTGKLGRRVLAPLVEHLNKVANLQIEICAVENKFFGPSVTVAGLLTGGDIISALQRQRPGDLVLIPSVALKTGEDVFLDNMSLAQLQARLQKHVYKAGSPREIISAITKSTGESDE
ncbi:DUF512 domain-containing protein [Desulfurispora thermophila]|uniref:DUF512 domain-containing protein n=1 Tax=Desulfurispora thermophila TaxID=265470 RepID=UPI0005266B8E